MINNKYFISTIVIMLLFMICHNSDSETIKHKPFKCLIFEITDTLGIIDANLYLPGLDKLNAKKILEQCNAGTTIDSSMEIMEKVTLHTYKIVYKGSEMNIYHYQSSNGENGFVIGIYTLTSNIFKIENGIQIGMTKQDFLKKLNVKNADCDILIVSPNGPSMDYYKFYFKHNCLKRIDKAIVTP